MSSLSSFRFFAFTFSVLARGMRGFFLYSDVWSLFAFRLTLWSVTPDVLAIGPPPLSPNRDHRHSDLHGPVS